MVNQTTNLKMLLARDSGSAHAEVPLNLMG